MWLRQTEWSLVTVLIVTPVQTVNSAQESLKASLSGERGFCKCQMTWQKVKKTLNILHCAACKFRTKTPRNLLAAGLGTNYFLCWKLLKPNPAFPHSVTKISSLVIPWVPLFQKSVTNSKALPRLHFWAERVVSALLWWMALAQSLGITHGHCPSLSPALLQPQGFNCLWSHTSSAASTLLHGCPSLRVPPTRCF